MRDVVLPATSLASRPSTCAHCCFPVPPLPSPLSPLPDCPLQGILRDHNGQLSDGGRLAAGFAAGITEALLIVTPFEVVKIRLQQQKGLAYKQLKYHVSGDARGGAGARDCCKGAALCCLAQASCTTTAAAAAQPLLVEYIKCSE